MAPTQPTNGSSARSRRTARSGGRRDDAAVGGTREPGAFVRALRRPHRRGGRHGRQDYGRAGSRSDADRARRRRLAAAGARAGHRRRGRRRGHPAARAADPRARRDRDRPGGLVLRGQRDRPHPLARRGDARRRAGAAGDRRGDAQRVRPRVPAGRGRPRGGRRRHRRPRPLGRAHGAGGLGAPGRPVLLRGLPAPQGRRAGPAPRRPGRRAAHDGVLRGAPPHRDGAGGDGGGVRGRPARPRSAAS